MKVESERKEQLTLFRRLYFHTTHMIVPQAHLNFPLSSFHSQLLSEERTNTMSTKETKKITIYIPTEGNGDYVDGCLNGKNFRVKTGVMAEVPLHIARILEEAGRATRMSQGMAAAFTSPGGKKVG